MVADQSGDVRAALRDVVAAHGPGALSSPALMSNLLKDLLPDAPRFAQILVAAADCHVADALRDHVAGGLDPGTAASLAAASFAGSTMFSSDACAWVVAEIAIALGVASETAGPPTVVPGPAGAASAVGGATSKAPTAPGGGESMAATGEAGYQPTDVTSADPARTARLLAARHVRSLSGHHAPVHAMSFSPDGHLLATHDSHGELMLWDTTADIPPRRLTLSRAGYSPAIAFSPDGHLMAVSTDTGATVQLLEPASGSRQRALGVPHDRSFFHHFAGTALSFTADGRLLAAFCTAEQAVWLWDSATGQRTSTVRLKAPVAELLRPRRERNIGAAIFSPGMGLLAIHNHRDTVHLWDPLSGRRQRIITGNYPTVSAIAFRGDGRVLAACSSDDTIRLWDCDTGQNVLTFKGSRSSLAHGSAFDFRDRFVATADFLGIQIWDSATGRHVQALSPPERGRLNGQITCLAFSPEGRLLAAGESQMKHTDRSDVFPTLVHLWEMTSPLGNG